MTSLWMRVPDDERELVIAELWNAGTAGITEEPDGLRAFFEDEAHARNAARTLQAYSPEWHTEEERDWEAESRAAWQPFRVGERFYLVPEWRDDPAPEGLLRLTIYPGLACGTGAGPATQLCLQAMERWVAAGSRAIDVGTGTGILADAALLLGAAPVIACDIDHAASVIARRCVLAAVSVFTGSVRSLRDGSAATLIANLNAATLFALAPELLRVVAKDGTLILSGFRVHEFDAVVRAFARPVRDRLESGEWACAVL